MIELLGGRSLTQVQSLSAGSAQGHWNTDTWQAYLGSTLLFASVRWPRRRTGGKAQKLQLGIHHGCRDIQAPS